MQKRTFEFLGTPPSSVGYCDVDAGCMIAAAKMFGNNGIARAANGTFYVASAFFGELHVMERLSNNTLVITEVIETGEHELFPGLSFF